jgi:hypothetical protein
MSYYTHTQKRSRGGPTNKAPRAALPTTALQYSVRRPARAPPGAALRRAAQPAPYPALLLGAGSAQRLSPQTCLRTAGREGLSVRGDAYQCIGAAAPGEAAPRRGLRGRRQAHRGRRWRRWWRGCRGRWRWRRSSPASSTRRLSMGSRAGKLACGMLQQARARPSAPRVAPCAVPAGCSAGCSEEAGPTAVPSLEHMPRPEGVIGRAKVMIIAHAGAHGQGMCVRGVRLSHDPKRDGCGMWAM